MNKTLFHTFLRIGLLTLGGWHSVLPLTETVVVDKRRWMDKERYGSLVTMARTCPGIFAVNLTLLIGNDVRGVKGAFAAAFGVALPSLTIVVILSALCLAFRDVPWVAAAFAGIRPAVVALMAIPTWNMAMKAGINLMNCWVLIVSAMLIWLLGINPVYILLTAGVGGYVYGQFIKPSE